MSVEIIERIVQPIVDPDTDVIVYVPGYANMGPDTPTLVDSNNFTALFGDSPYIFKANQLSATVASNKSYKGRPEKSWLFAKGLVDAGLTVLFHRTNPSKIGTANTGAEAFSLIYGAITTGGKLSKENAIEDTDCRFSAKYFGSYYTRYSVTVTNNFRGGTTTVQVIDTKNKNKVVESATVTFDPTKTNYIGSYDFTYVRFEIKPDGGTDEDWTDDLSSLNLDGLYAEGNGVYIKAAASKPLTGVTASSDEFTVAGFETALGTAGKGPWEELKDTETYQAVTYLTTGGYFANATIAGEMQKVAYAIKSMALVDLDTGTKMTNSTSFDAYQDALLTTGSESAEKAKSAMFYGADTYTMSGFRVIIPDSYGYLLKLASNLKAGIPAWIPVANNPQGVVSAIATTHPVNYSMKESMVVDAGISINPIIYKQNAGYTIMGNRTLYSTSGVPGPDSFLNCQLVVNTVARAARTVAQDLQIVSTNAQEAFSTFKSKVSKTCEKMLANKDGLYAYSITKKKKTKPATIDIVIELTVVEGIEHFVVEISQQLNLEG